MKRRFKSLRIIGILILVFICVFLISVFLSPFDNNDSDEKNVSTVFDTNTQFKQFSEIEKTTPPYYHQQEELMLDKLASMVGVDKIPIDSNNQQSFSVAILDTGVFPHKDLVLPNNRIIAFKDFINEKENAYDDNGHGTAIAGIIGGNGYQSDSKYCGLAPFVNIVAIKVLDHDCKGTSNSVSDGIYWAIENKAKFNIKIINISIGVQIDDLRSNDKVAIAAEEAYNEGIFVVASVGNIKDKKTVLYSPAISKSVVAVGSIKNVEFREDCQYEIAEFSSYWKDNDGNIKPNLVAPGCNIVSLKSDKFYKGNGNFNSDLLYSSLGSGTSESSAVVTGIVAILIYKFPEKSFEQIKEVLYKNCVLLENEGDKQGKGFVFLRGENLY